MVQLLGGNIRRASSIVFALGAAIAGLVGAAASPIYSVDPSTGLRVSRAVVRRRRRRRARQLLGRGARRSADRRAAERHDARLRAGFATSSSICAWRWCCSSGRRVCSARARSSASHDAAGHRAAGAPRAAQRSVLGGDVRFALLTALGLAVFPLAAASDRRLRGARDADPDRQHRDDRVQPAARLRRDAVVRARDVLRRRRLHRGDPARALDAGTIRISGSRRSARRSRPRSSPCAIGALTVRLYGIYFALLTLAFAQMVYFIVEQGKDWTNGDDGIQSIPNALVALGAVEHRSHDAAAGDRPRARSATFRDIKLWYVFAARHAAGRAAVRARAQPLAVRRSARRDPRERAAQRVRRLQRRRIPAGGVHDLRRADGLFRRAARAVRRLDRRSIASASTAAARS